MGTYICIVYMNESQDFERTFKKHVLPLGKDTQWIFLRQNNIWDLHSREIAKGAYEICVIVISSDKRILMCNPKWYKFDIDWTWYQCLFEWVQRHHDYGTFGRSVTLYIIPCCFGLVDRNELDWKMCLKDAFDTNGIQCYSSETNIQGL